MIVFHEPAEVPAGFGRSIAAIGKFDGVHVGHRAIIERARARANRNGAKVVAVTFDRNPLRTLRPGACPADLIGPTQKLRLLKQAGVDATLMLRFDEALAAVDASDFVADVLVEALQVDAVLVGRDFRFGRAGAGDPALLARMGSIFGFSVDVMGEVLPGGGSRRISSTWIRELLAEGRVEEAALLLGRRPSLWGTVGHSSELEESEADGFVPREGLYAGTVITPPGSRRPWAACPVVIDISGAAVGSDGSGGNIIRMFSADGTLPQLAGRAVELRFEARVQPAISPAPAPTFRLVNGF